ITMTDVLSSPSPAATRPRFRALKIIALASSAASESRIRLAFSDREQFGVQILNPQTPLGHGHTLARPDLVIIDANLSDLGAGPAVERLIAGDLNGAPILVFADILAPDSARRLMRIGAAEVLDATTLLPSDLVDAAIKAIGSRKNEASARLSALFSARG